MGEITKKKTVYNPEILKLLIAKYGLSKDYIQKSLRGDRVGIIPDKLKREYNNLDNAAQAAMKKIIND